MARRGDTSKPKLNAQERYQARVQHNKIVSQLERLDDQYSPEEIRNAGNDAWKELGGADMVRDPTTGKWGGGTYTIADGDNLSTIADAHGTTPTDILKANPDLKAPKTGMVVSIPGSEAWRVQNVGGLPSNAAQGAALSGALSTYREGEKNYTPGMTPAQAPSVNPNSRYISGQQGNPFGSFFQNLFGSGSAQQPYMKTPGGIVPATQNISNPLGGLFSGSGQQPFTRGPGGVLPVANNAPSIQPAAAPGAQTTPAQNQFNPTFRTKDDYLPAQWAALAAMTTYTPSAAQVQYLLKYGMIQPTTASGGGGGGYSGSSKGKGGKGGGGKAPKASSGGPDYARAEREPAFGSGGGFRGLVNWRI